MFIIVFVAWSWAIQRQWSYGPSGPDLMSVFVYLWFSGVCFVIGCGVGYIRVFWKARADYIEYRNYLLFDEENEMDFGCSIEDFL